MIKIPLKGAVLVAALVPTLIGCSSEQATATAEEKKAFGGSAPPADYMKGIQAGQAAGQKAAAEAAAKHGG